MADQLDAVAISADQMKLVLDVSRLLTVTADLDSLLQQIATAATSLIQSERASIFLHDPQTQQLWTMVALGAGQIRVPASAGIVGHVFQTNRLLETPRPYEDPRFNPEVDRRAGFLTRNLLTAPLCNLDGTPLGVLQIVNRIGGPFTAIDHAMTQLLADHAGVAIQRHRLQQEIVRTVELRHEMDLAQRVQMAMLPQQPPRIPHLRCDGWTRSASVTGGDCYDLWELPDGRLGIFLADASGHGIAPALIVSQVRTLVRALFDFETDPGTLLRRINARLAADLESGRFVTAFLGFMDSNGLLHWCSAGHGPLLCRRGSEGSFERLDPVAPPLGILPELPLDPAPPIQLGPGGVFAVLSDGLFEAPNPSGELYDVPRIAELLGACRDEPPARMLAALRRAMVQWQRREEPADDQTVVIVQRAE